MAQYGTEITNYYAPYRYQGPPSLVGSSGSGGNKKKNVAYLAPGRRQAGGDMLQPNGTSAQTVGSGRSILGQREPR